MKRNFCKILCFLTIGFFLVLFVQEKWHPFQMKPLSGVTVETTFPELTFEKFVSGEVQSDMEQYSKDNFGFREGLIRLYNQYLWDCYRKSYSKTVYVGEEGWLYEKEIVEDYIGKRMYDFAESPEALKAKLSTEAVRLKKVQDILACYGKHLFVLMEPDKARTYPEYFPKNLKKTDNPDAVAANIYPHLFDSLGVNCMNVDAWFRQIKGSVDYALYPQTGTHWSNLAALHAMDSIIGYMESLGGLKMKELQISDVKYDTTMTPDDDLEKLLNVNKRSHDIPNYYADFTLTNDSIAMLPAWIHIGDSYYWNLSYHIPLDDIFSYHHYWYYNSSIFYDSEYTSTRDINLIGQLMSADFVSLGYCTAQLYGLSSRFSAQALVNLCHNAEEVEAAVQGIEQNIYSNEQWKASLQEKAESEGRSLEDVVRDDALYLLYSDPESYFLDLLDEHPASRNEMLCMFLPDDAMGQILRNMHNNPEWLAALKEKAEEQHVSLETVMIRDAKWVLDNQ